MSGIPCSWICTEGFCRSSLPMQRQTHNARPAPNMNKHAQHTPWVQQDSELPTGQTVDKSPYLCSPTSMRITSNRNTMAWVVNQPTDIIEQIVRWVTHCNRADKNEYADAGQSHTAAEQALCARIINHSVKYCNTLISVDNQFDQTSLQTGHTEQRCCRGCQDRHGAISWCNGRAGAGLVTDKRQEDIRCTFDDNRCIHTKVLVYRSHTLD